MMKVQSKYDLTELRLQGDYFEADELGAFISSLRRSYSNTDKGEH